MENKNKELKIEDLVKASQSGEDAYTLWNISAEEWKKWLDTVSSEEINAILSEISTEEAVREYDKSKIEKILAPYKKPLDDDSLELRFG